VDAGEQFALSDAQTDYAIGSVSTSMLSTPDTGFADMGFHYAVFTGGAVEYQVVVNVVGNGQLQLTDAASGTSVLVGPDQPGTVLRYAPGTILGLEALPEPGYRVFQWTGTEFDVRTVSTNALIVGMDTTLSVEFEEKVPRTLNVPGSFKTIQEAVNAARDGDVVMVDPGTYNSGYLAFGLVVDRPVTITSRNPDDPDVVAATIIDGLNTTNDFANLGILFTSQSGPDTVLNGFTIQNCGAAWTDGEDGDRDAGLPDGEDGAPGQGAAIIITSGASPTIKNCIIRSNEVRAGDGGNGVDADDTNNAGRGGWGGWARGAGAYCGFDSSPTFINCTFEDNFVRGGDAGDGGAWNDGGGIANYGGNYSRSRALNISSTGLGLQLEEQDLWQVWDWDYADEYWLDLLVPSLGIFDPEKAAALADPNVLDTLVGRTSYFGDYRWYSGYGGAVFCETGSDVRFVHCDIRNNRTFGGLSGLGGVWEADRNIEPLVPFEMPSFGAGVYCAADTVVSFDGCTFEGNVTSEVLAGQDPNFRLDPYVGYGGGVCAESSARVEFADCNFIDNLADTGGAVYLADSTASVVDCNIASNTALRGAGIGGLGGTIDIIDCDIRNNEAIADVNDANDTGAFGAGGGLFLASTSALVQDCNVTGNVSNGSGGGIYLRGGEYDMAVINCLIRGNTAERDGGGLSTNWYAMPLIRNCTFFGNAAVGLGGDPNNGGIGGGLFCAYHSDATVTDSIFWKNFARLGGEIAVATGFEYDPQCGKLFVSHSDITLAANDVWVDTDCELTYGEGILRQDPRFVEGPLGDFYLAHSSPCVDAGSDLAAILGMSRYTTRTDGAPDTGQVDIGYHSPFLEPCRFCDLVLDGIIRFDDFAKFAQKWLDEGCSEADGWCDGADFTFDSKVDARDVAVFADCWLVRDTTPPSPDPMEWDVAPYMDDSTTVTMRAEEATDAWGWVVEYYFECVEGPGHDSGWRTKRSYSDGVPKGASFGYRVKARDALGNETEWSKILRTGTADTTPPAPAPYIVTADPNSTLEVILTARVSYDDSGVQYFFDTNTPGAHDSGWIDTPVYTDVNLVPSTRYCYRVKARDLSSRHNETAYSPFVCVTTLTPIETLTPTPDPMEFDPNGLPRELYLGAGWNDYWADMTAVTATDASGGVEYYFEAKGFEGLYPPGGPVDGQLPSGAGLSSGWIAANTWRVRVGRQGQRILFRVKARDIYGNETEWSEYEPSIVRGSVTPPAANQPGGGVVPGGGVAPGGGVVPGGGIVP